MVKQTEFPGVLNLVTTTLGDAGRCTEEKQKDVVKTPNAHGRRKTLLGSGCNTPPLIICYPVYPRTQEPRNSELCEAQTARFDSCE